MLNEEEHHLIWMSGQSWDGVAGTHRNMATALTRYARILWVDPPVSPVTSAAGWPRIKRSIKPTLTAVNNQITRLTPMVLPGFTRPIVRETTSVLVLRQARRAMRMLGIQPFAVVDAYVGNYLGHWGDDVVNVLYGTDDYVAGATLMGVSARNLRQRELRSLAQADVVAVITPQLAQRWTDLGASPIVIPNGCWPNRGHNNSAPPELQDLTPPVVGLVGQLSDRIDLDVLHAIADGGFTLLLVGPVDQRCEQSSRFRELVARPNVRFVGRVPADEVPSYLAAIDVGITPYRDTSFNRASFPLKTLEYLAAGIPTVSADLPAARWLHADLLKQQPDTPAEDVLALARSNDEYLSAVSHMAAVQRCKERDAIASVRHSSAWDKTNSCIEFASRHSWPLRAEMFASAIGLLPQ